MSVIGRRCSTSVLTGRLGGEVTSDKAAIENAMVEIISKSNGPRREDAAAKHFLRENSETINKIAMQLSGGRLRGLPSKEARNTAVVSKRIRSAPSRDAVKSPYTKVSLNGRVIAVDFNSGRQLHYLGELRGVGASRKFVLASVENGVFAPLADDLVSILRQLDGWPAPDDSAQEELVQKIDALLGFSISS